MTRIDGENHYDALVIGAGVIGLACAWRAAERGLRVCVLERDHPGAGASGIAAGMLAPVGEASWGEEELLNLNLASHRLWPGFAEQLRDATAEEVGYSRRGALHVALDRDEAAELRRRYELHRELGLPSHWLRPSDCRRLEGGLSARVAGGLHAEGEAAVDPRQLCRALASALAAAGGVLKTGAEVIAADFDRPIAELGTADGRRFEAPKVLLAAGCWSGHPKWLPEPARSPVRPVKGEILTLRGSADQPVCKRLIVTERVYLVPRSDGQLIVGATVEERGFDTTVTAGGVHELLREAYRALPEVSELELLEARAGLRPGTPDNRPLIGPTAVEGLLLASGHYRNGVLLAPVTAEAIAGLLADRQPGIDLDPFSPARFGRAGASPDPEVALR
jgi:glycine oxidase